MSMSYKWNRNKLPWTWSWVDYDTGIRFCVKYSPRTVSLGPDAAQSTCPGATHQNFCLAIVQVQGAKRVLNTPTYCSKNRSRHAPRTQTEGLSTFFGDPNTLKSGPFKRCLYPMHPRPNAFVVRTEFKSARVSTRVILGGSHKRPGFSSRIVWKHPESTSFIAFRWKPAHLVALFTPGVLKDYLGQPRPKLPQSPRKSIWTSVVKTRILQNRHT